MNARSRFLFASIVFLSLGLTVGSAEAKDVEGSLDHPMISRYAGSEIIRYDDREFDEYALLTSEAKHYGGKEKNLESCRMLEGRVTKITYRAPAGRSTLEVFRNYESALKEAGFEVLFGCDDQVCGGRNFNHAVVPYDLIFGDNYEDQRYLAAVLPREEGDIFISLYVARDEGAGSAAATQLDVITTKPMESGMVTIDADAMAKGIAAEGHIAVYGIYFDTDKADIKPESKPTLDEIAKLLTSEPTLEVMVVGHTDNVGTPEYNLGLSQKRAQAVVNALSSVYGVAPTRLSNSGAGLTSPVASNRTEEGRAKNRRVELVER
ncbi:MAG: DUF4892 domain-containing protein [Deltaproteobacteria bacterium]|nr:DUF4892 domain-containing protein [Deltaproteobacteria bacterium]